MKERLRYAVHRRVREKLADHELLARSPRRAPENNLMKLVAAIAIADPGLPLRDPPSLIRWESGRRAVGANGRLPPFATCWTKHIDLASFVLEGAEHQPADCPVSCAPALDGRDFQPTLSAMPRASCRYLVPHGDLGLTRPASKRGVGSI